MCVCVCEQCSVCVGVYLLVWRCNTVVAIPVVT